MNERTRHAPPGTTLLELAVVLLILAVLLGLAHPPLRRGVDRLAARSARDALVAGLARTRAAAVARGGAALVVDVEGARYWIEAADGARLADVVDLGAAWGVRLAADGAAPRVALRYDALGIGRMASRTIRVRRGAAEARLSVSTYGRPRPW